jgi:hypothetical protein
VRVVALLAAACTNDDPDGDDPTTPLEVGPPTLVSHEVRCSIEEDTWTIEAVTTGFSAGASTWWTDDGVYVERHDLQVLTSAPDGSEETFDDTFGIVSDWRDQGPTSTAFVCASDPTIVFQLEALDGTWSDCFAYGPAPELFDALAFVPECPEA